MTNPTTPREKLRASIYAILDASDLDASLDSWPASTKVADGGTAGDAPDYPRSWLDYVMDTSAAEVAGMVLSVEDHPSRSAFMTLSGPYDVATKLNFFGRPGDVYVSPTGASDGYEEAFENSPEMVKWSREHYTKVAGIGDEYYWISPSNVIYFTGNPGATKAMVYLGFYDVYWTVTDPLLTFPGEMIPAVEAAALARLFAQNADLLDGARYFSGEWAKRAGIIAQKGVPDRVNPYIRESA